MFDSVSAPTPDNCQAYFTETALQYNTSALFFEWTNSSSYPLPNIKADLASFMLVRGDYAWLGYGWIGCTLDKVPGSYIRGTHDYS